jgi:alpha-2-macroglobulin-like protein
VTRTKKQGYEWFGQTAPPHEALTAYGLLQFLDMAKYHEVDKAMLERTKQYLLGQRNGKGGFLRNTRAIDGFGRAPDHITDAYIVWALCEAEVKEDITLELNTVVAKANETQDPYLLALASLGLLKRGQNDAAVPLLKKLVAKQKDDGSLIASQTSITHSGGTQLAVETTSLAVLAWLRANQPQQFTDAVRKGTEWIGKQRGAFGGYGSTQSTILALKALIAYTKENKRTAEAGELRLYVAGRAEPVAIKAFAAGTLDPLIVELADDTLLQPGDNKVRVEITGKNIFPYTLTWSYMALTPANKDACPVRLTTKLATVQVGSDRINAVQVGDDRINAVTTSEGQSVRVTAVLENASGQEQGMAVAIVGLPGGCALPADLQELRNLVREGKIDAFEVRGRELVLYWRGLAKDAKHEVNFNVICQVPGQYRGPASRAYLYYNTDERWWVTPLAVDIAAR